MKTFIAALSFAALCIGCSKDDPTTTPPAEPTPVTAAEEAETEKEVEELAKEIEADLADEG